MKKSYNILFIVALFIIATACEKKEADPTPAPPVQQNDQSGSTEADKALDDVNDIINNKIGGGSNQRTAAYNLPCGIIKVDSSAKNAANNKIYKLQYGEQTQCNVYKKKSGDISFELAKGTHFSDSGAVILVKFVNYLVEVIATGETVKLNGTFTVTNLEGGFIWQAVTDSKTIIHKVRGTFKITYTNGVERERKYFHLKTWASENGWAGVSLTVAGDTLIGDKHVSETGKTYEHSYDFKTEIIQDFKWENCGDTWKGPYVLKYGHARLNVTVPGISPVYFELEAGYKYTIASLEKLNNCNSNAYKITTTIGQHVVNSHQPY